MSFKQYARKLFQRKRGFRDDQNALKMFEKEIGHLKRLSHHHLVKLVGSYTDPKYMAFLMEPIADGNLTHFLSQSMTQLDEQLPSLRNFFGCLANAVAYLHAQQIRHRDLKPENILIKDLTVFITDFGNSLDWSQRGGRETTLDHSVPRTWRYVAPEIAQGVRRNSASDIWSLGVVYLEMLTVLRGQTVRGMRAFMGTHGNRQEFVYMNPQAATQWFEELLKSGSGPDSDNQPLEWIKEMTQPVPARRPRAWDIANQIRSSTLTTSFMGFCCANESELYCCPSPPPSTFSDEEDDVTIQEQLKLLEPIEMQYGSLISQTQHSSVETWLTAAEDAWTEESLRPSLGEDEFTMYDPYGTSVDKTIRPLARFAIDSDMHADVDTQVKVVESYDTYEVIGDVSDEENPVESDLYEFVEDSSGS